MSVATVSRQILAAVAGLTFLGKRDTYTTFGYPSEVTYEDCFLKYQRQDIARRIIQAPAAATWSRGVEIKDNEEFNTTWKTLQTSSSLMNVFERTDRLAGLGTFAALFIGFDDSAAADKPAKNAKNILFMQPYNETNVKVKSIVMDTKDPRFGKPLLYTLTAQDPDELKAADFGQKILKGQEIEVHWSRILHVAEDVLESELFGTPRMKPIFNRLLDLEKVVGGSAETFWLTGNRGLHLDVDKEMELTTEDAQDLSDEIEEYEHGLRRVIRTKGVGVKNLGSDVASPKDHFQVLIACISGATGIPQRILLGSEAGQLASEQDRANWAERINERRVEFAEASILRPFIKLCILAGVLPVIEVLEFVWPNAFVLSPLEESEMSAKRARGVANLAGRTKNGSPVVTDNEAREVVGFEPIEAAALEEGTSGMPSDEPDENEDPLDDEDPEKSSDPNENEEDKAVKED